MKTIIFEKIYMYVSLFVINSVFVLPMNKEQLLGYLFYWAVFFMYVMTGSMVKLAYDHEVLKKVITFKKAFVTLIFSFFICYEINGLILKYDCDEWSFFVIPVTALLSEKILITIMVKSPKWFDNIGMSVASGIATKLNSYLNGNKNRKYDNENNE